MERSIRLAFQRASKMALAAASEAEPSKRDHKTLESKSLLNKAINLLTTARAQRSDLMDTSSNAPELVVVAAETCLTCSEYTKSRALAETYFEQINSASSSPDQFTVRALFIMAKTESILPSETPLPVDASQPADRSFPTIHGAEAVRRILRATRYLTKAISIAQKNPVYNFLIYNASVHYWNVTRPLMRTETFKFLAPTLTLVCDALDAVDDEDYNWRIQLNQALCKSLDEAGEYSASASRVSLTVELAKQFLATATEASDEIQTNYLDAETETKRIMKLLRSLSGEADPSEADLDEEEKSSPPSPRPDDEDEAPPPPTLEECEQMLSDAERVQSKLNAIYKERQAFQGEVYALCQKLAYLRLHIGRNADKNPDCKKLLDDAEKDHDLFSLSHLAEAKVKLQKLRSEIFDGKDEGDKRNNARATLQGIVDSIVPAPLPEDPEDPTPKSVDIPSDSIELLVDVGRCAAHLLFDDLAASIIESCKNTKIVGSPTFRVKLDYLKCEVQAKELDSKDSITDDTPGAVPIDPSAKKKMSALSSKKALPPSKLDARHVDALRLSRRVEALKLLDRTIMSARRLGDPDLLQEGAVLAWNLGLPLLQPHLRKHVHRVFNLAAQVLQEISSPLTPLRAMLHLEVAKCELSSDFLAKASQHVTESIQQDYGHIDVDRVMSPEMTTDEYPCFPTPVEPTPEDVAKADAKNSELRKLDRYAFPMHRKLELRTSIYSEPDNAEEKALLQLEQAKEVSDVGLQKTLLQKSAGLLEMSSEASSSSSPPPSPTSSPSRQAPSICLEDIIDEANPLAIGDGEPMQAPPQSTKSQTSLWSEIVDMAWSLRHTQLVKRAVVPILSNVWSVEKNREFVVMQVKAHFTLAEALVEELKLTIVPPLPIPSSDDDENNTPRTSKRPDPRALGIPCERDSLLAPPAAFADKVDKLKIQTISAISCGIKRAVKLGPTALYLVESGAVLLWNFHIHIFRAQAYANVLPSLTEALATAHSALISTSSKDAPLLASISEALALSSEVSGDLNAAEKWCVDCIPFGRPMQMKRLVEILARLKYSRGSKDVAPPVDTKSGQKPNSLFNVSATAVAIASAAKKGEATLAERASLLTSSFSELSKFREERYDPPSEDGTARASTLEDDEEALEYEAELWVRLADESLSQGLLRQAQACCSFATEQLPAQPELRKRVPVNTWRWYSCAENIWGRAIAAMVNEEGQDRSLQDELRRAALKHLVTAARHSGRARKPDLVLNATLNLWNIALPLTLSKISRKQIFPFVKHALSEMSHANVTSHSDFRVNLYILLFECYTDAEDWNGGLAAVNEAFMSIPASFQRPLWQRRVVFMSKLGKGVLDGMQKMKESDPVLQARIWVILARSASSTKQQMSAYIQAISSLEGKFERLEYCIEMAEWMIQTGLSKKDYTDVLMSAVDSFMAVEEAAFPELLGPENANYNSDDDDIATNDGENDSNSIRSGFASRGNLGTSHTNNPLSRNSSRASMTAGGRTSAPGTASNTGSASRNPSAPTTANSTVRRSMSQRSVRSARSNNSDTTNNDQSGKSESAPEALDVSHMNSFIKALAMLAKCADGFRVRTEMALSAAHYAERALLLTIDAANAGAAMADFEKLDDEEKVKCGGLKEFTSSRAKPYATPYRMEDWSDYSITKSILGHCKNVPHNQQMKVVSKMTMAKAPLIISHLFYVSDLLCEEGMTLQALPLLVLAEFVSHLATNTRNENLIALCGAKTAVALANLGKPSVVASRFSTCGPYGLDGNSSKKYKDEVEQIELQRYGRILAKGDMKSDDTPTKSMVFFSEKRGTVEDARKIKVRSFEVRHLWCSIAEQMVILEQPNTAAQYIEEALRHCSAFDDLACRAKCMIVKAKVAMLNGDIRDSVESCKLARFALKNVGGGESSEWAEASLLMASAVSGPPSYSKGEAKKILNATFAVFQDRVKSVPEMMRVAAGDPSFVEQNGEIDIESVYNYIRVGKAYVEALASEAISARASGSPWWDNWTECLEIVNGCCNLLASLSNGGDSILERDKLRPPQLLVDMLDFQSQLVLRMKPSDVFMDDLKEAIGLLSQASKLALDCHAFSCPPEHTEQQQGLVILPPEGTEGAEEASGVAPPPPVPRVTLPTARRAANLQIELCKLHLVCAKLNNEHVSSKEAEEAYEREVTDPVARYLDVTAPVVLKDSDTKIQSLQTALFCATSARRLAKYCPLIISAANAVVGECLGLLSSQKGLLDMAWDVELSACASSTALSHGSLTPSASATDLAAAGGGGSKKGKDMKKEGGKKKGDNDESLAEAPAAFDIDKLDEEVAIDENGDIRSQALALLSAAGNSLAALGCFDAATDSYMSACEAAGSAVGGEGDPVTALRSLLKGQAAGSSNWFRKLRMTSTEVNTATRNRIFNRVLERTDRDRGTMGDCNEDSTFRPLAGGNHGAGSHNFPPVKIAKAYLNENSTAWKRNMSFGASGDSFVDDLLFAMPDDVRLFVLQLSGDGTTIYCGVASKMNMPAIAKVALGKGEVAELADLTARMKTVESSGFSKFMIRYADENGEDGNFIAKEEKKEGKGLFINDDGEDDIRDVVKRMNAFMSGILSKLQVVNAFAEAEESESNIVIIPDVRLQVLPLEALDCLKKCKSVSRDFSAQIFLSRLASYVRSGPPASKNFKYIADPRWEDKGSENASKPRDSVLEVMERLCDKGGVCSTFGGIVGSEKIPSDGEWQNSLAGANEEEAGSARGFFYYGPGRCLARFEPGLLSGLNIDNSQLVVLVDRAENDSSYRRQSKLDNQKRPDHLTLENALETAALFSLAGANSVVLNRWATSFHANSKFIETFYEKMMAGGTCSEAMQAFRELQAKGFEGLKNRIKYNTVVIGLPNVTISK